MKFINNQTTPALRNLVDPAYRTMALNPTIGNGYTPLFGVIKPSGFGAVDLASAIFNVSSPDQAPLFQLGCLVAIDNKRPTWLRAGAVALALVTGAQSVSDIHSRVDGKPRVWLGGDKPDRIPREQFLALMRSPLAFPLRQQPVKRLSAKRGGKKKLGRPVLGDL